MSQEPDHFDLPPALADALRGAYAHRPTFPAAVDDAVLSAAREKFARRRRMKLMAQWGTGLAAGLAAAIVIVVNVSNPPAAPTPTPTVATNVRGDVNADGRVDMADALALAQRVAANSAGDTAWDVTGDGKVDTADVDAIAVASVSLKQQGVTKAGLPKLDQLGIGNGIVGARGVGRGNHAVALRAGVTGGDPAARTEPRPPVGAFTEVRQ